MAQVPVFHSFARSGGTLVNQLLGVHPQCLVLSEVNPAASYKPVAEQAVEWLGLLQPGEAGAFDGMPYDRQIAALRERAQAHGRRLVVRDWVTVNFLPGTAGGTLVPSGELEQELYLERAGLAPVAVVVTRAGAAVYDSIRRSFAHLHDLALDRFAEAYLAYARRVAHLPRISLEALRERPAETIAELLARLGLEPCDPRTLLDRFADFVNCTGNTTLAASSRSAGARSVLPPDENRAAHAQSHPALADADRLLGYGR